MIPHETNVIALYAFELSLFFYFLSRSTTVLSTMVRVDLMIPSEFKPEIFMPDALSFIWFTGASSW